MQKDKILDMIQKLLSLQKGTKYPHEAEAAAAKVQELLLKYNLEMDDVNTFTPEEESIVKEDIFETGEKKSESTWILNLYQVVARYNFCRVLSFSRMRARDNPHGTVATIIGREGNREAVQYMVEWLIPNIRNLATEAFNEYEGSEKKGKFRRGFLMGCTEGIGTKLHNEWLRAQQADSKTTAVVARNDKEMGAFMKKVYPVLTSTRKKSLSSWDGRDEGTKAGQSMEIRRGVGTSKTSGHLKGDN